MTQLTMPDRAAARTGGTSPAAGRDGADLATSTRVLEARKALLAGAAAALDAPGRAAGLFEAALADPGARWWPFALAHLYRIFPKLGIGSRAALRDALNHRAAA
jgi:hypothetical protein